MKKLIALSLALATAASTHVALANVELTPSPNDNISLRPDNERPRGSTPRVEDAGQQSVGEHTRPSQVTTNYPDDPINSNPGGGNGGGGNDGGGNNTPNNNPGGGGGKKHKKPATPEGAVTPEFRQQIIDLLMKIIVYRMNLLRAASGLPQFDVKG